MNIAEDETWLIREISTKIKSHPDPAISELSILVRPHPANTKHYAHLDDDDLIVWPKEGELPQKFESQRDFYNSVVHSALTAGINTSGMIDAIIIGKPCLTVMAPQYRRTQEQAAHFKILLEADILEVAQNTDEAVDRIDHILQGVDSRALRRKLFRRDFARPLGENRPAGLVAAEVIEKLVEGIPVNQIRSRLNCYDVTKADDSIRTDVI